METCRFSNTIKTESYHIGEDIKILFELKGDDFDMDRDAFDIVVTCGGKAKTLTSSNLILDSKGKHYLCINTNDFGIGTLNVRVTLYIPDSAFPSGYRRQVIVRDICPIVS